MDFSTYNDWITFTHGKNSIILDFREPTIPTLRTARGRMVNGWAEVNRWLDERNLRGAFTEWRAAREDAVSKWLENTPHKSFYADGGTLALRINCAGALRIGCGGDGWHQLYFMTEAEVPPFWTSTGISLEDCTVEPMDYDCEGGKPIEKVDCKFAWVYTHGGDILVNVYKD